MHMHNGTCNNKNNKKDDDDNDKIKIKNRNRNRNRHQPLGGGGLLEKIIEIFQFSVNHFYLFAGFWRNSWKFIEICQSKAPPPPPSLLPPPPRASLKSNLRTHEVVSVGFSSDRRPIRADNISLRTPRSCGNVRSLARSKQESDEPSSGSCARDLSREPSVREPSVFWRIPRSYRSVRSFACFKQESDEPSSGSCARDLTSCAVSREPSVRGGAWLALVDWLSSQRSSRAERAAAVQLLSLRSRETQAVSREPSVQGGA